MFLLHSGDVLELTHEGAAVVDQVQAGRVMIDGLGVGDIYAKEAEDVLEDAREVVRTTVRGLNVESSTDWESAKSAIRTALNCLVYERTKRRPMVIPVIMEL